MSKEKIVVADVAEKPVLSASAERARRQAHVDNYAKLSPVKYAMKKAALEAWIAKA